MEKQSEKTKNYIKIMSIGVAVDLICYLIGHFFHIPAWMDANGTAIVAMLLEPGAGILVGFVINFYKAAFIYTSKELIAYLLSASIAIIIGIGIRKKGKISIKRIIPLSFLCMLVNWNLAFLIDLWQGGVISHWENQFYHMARSQGHSKYMAMYLGIFGLKFLDCIIRIVVLYAAYYIIPKKWQNETYISEVSWKNPYFKRKQEDFIE
ncbi:MAG: hypothetical protein ACOX1S_05125 [Anaerostipes sp.]|jgi:energy-coupling factor transport system substrate-specific component